MAARHRTKPLSCLLALALSLAALLVVAPGAHAATLGCADDAGGVADLQSWVPAMLAATNEHRAAQGLAALQLDPSLSVASLWKARDLARRSYFAHDDPASGAAPARTPWERLTACGYTSGGTRAENIAAGQSSGRAFVTAWINSPGHRANIENSALRYVGFGVSSASSSTYGRYAVQMFSSNPGPASIVQPAGNEAPSRLPQSGSDDDAGSARATELQRTGAAITRTRCRGRLAVAGWCYRITVRGVLATSLGAGPAGTAVTISRRSAAGRYSQLATSTTSSTGAFVARAWLRPPSTATRTWLLRNAGVIRVATPAGPTTLASSTTVATRIHL